MSTPNINLLHIKDSKTLSGQDFNCQGHYSCLKGQINVTPGCFTPIIVNQHPYEVLTSYTLHFPRYSPDRLLKVKIVYLHSLKHFGV